MTKSGGLISIILSFLKILSLKNKKNLLTFQKNCKEINEKKYIFPVVEITTTDQRKPVRN